MTGAYKSKEFVQRWQKMTVLEQVANVGGEILRAMKWRREGNIASSQKAFEHGIKFMDLIIEGTTNSLRRKKFLLMRERLIDNFIDGNKFGSTDERWQRYFDRLAYAVRKNY